MIAQRLGVPVETLVDRQIDSYNDAMHILFELSDKYDLVPIELPQEPKYAIQTNISYFIAWSELLCICPYRSFFHVKRKPQLR